MIWKFKVRSETDVFHWVDLASILMITADNSEFELDLCGSLDSNIDAIEVDIIPISEDETHWEAVNRVIEAWTLCRRRLGAWK